jgi:LmbE family N-acetylglucosaminyl deacetylase
MTADPRGLTLMAVHAHPDDEAIGTGGVLARCAAEGIRTVLVTCTNGELGDAPNGANPGADGHDEAVVVAARREELERSCAILGVDHLELLGYRDSGMMGWDANTAPGSFWTTPIEEPARRLGALIEAYRPQVVVTYDANGFYGHPDHIQAHRVTMQAVEATRIPEKVYFTAVPRSALATFAETLRDAGVEGPDVAEDPEFGTPDELIAAVLDCSAFTDAKFDALAAHASQTENSFFLQMGRETFAKLFAFEAYVRAVDHTDAPIPESDLFAGLR